VKPVEPIVRQRYLALISLFASLPCMAMTFQTPLESVEWKVEGDQFECRLSQPINNFGAGEFVRRAGEKVIFRLTSSSGLLASGSATLLAAAAPWQPGRGDINLGAVRLGGGEALFNSSQGQASGLLGGLMEGRSTVVRSFSGDAGRAVEVRVLPVKFNKAYSDYQACTAKLLPMNYDQVRITQIGFPRGIELDAAGRKRLDTLLAYMKADPTVNHVELDGHSDNSGNRLNNRDLSRRRALAVMDYLKANGVTEEQITLRFHGERYPLVPNTSAANRARNRRVNIQLERVAPVEKPAPEAAKPAETPAAAPAPSKPAAIS
jgi:outer membrane protein OmpA-like peptidoglycan-associated protein